MLSATLLFLLLAVLVSSSQQYLITYSDCCQVSYYNSFPAISNSLKKKKRMYKVLMLTVIYVLYAHDVLSTHPPL